MIIFISGSMNSGKTTVSKLLEKKIPNTAFIEVDILRSMIDWMPLEKAIPINLKNAISEIKNFTENGLNTIIAYPIRRENYKYIMDNLSVINTKIYFFTLSPKLEITITDRGTRKLEPWQIERIKYHYIIGISNPSFGEIIDNTNQTPEETTNLIFSKIFL